MRSIHHLIFAILLLVSPSVWAETVPPPADPSVRHHLQIPEGGLPAFFRWQPMRLPLVSHHRGGPAPGYPENAIETMDHALAYGPGLMEVDIATLADGTLILMHDDTLDRTSNGTGIVAEKTWPDIKDLRLQDNAGTLTGFHIPTLDTVLNWAKGRAILTLDIKRGTDFAEVAAAVTQAHAQDHVVAIAYTMEQAQYFHRIAPGMMLTVTLENQADIDALLASGIPANLVIAWTGTRLRDPAFYAGLHQWGWRVIIGTLGTGDHAMDVQFAASGDDTRYLDLLAGGGDIIATDRFWAVQAQILNPNIYLFVRGHAAGIHP